MIVVKNFNLNSGVGGSSMIWSYVFGFAAWALSLVYVVKIYGVLGLLLGLLFGFLVPLAAITAALHGAWTIVIYLAAFVMIKYALRFTSLKASNTQSPRPTKGNVIDVEAREV